MNGKIHLYKELFTPGRRVVCENGELSASVFKYSTGVDAIEVRNSKGYFTVLPFMGQMIWEMNFLGRNMTMKSMFDEPEQCEAAYGESYGCFLMHCGLTFVGGPPAGAVAPFHAELPIAKYCDAFLNVGEDEKGKYIAVGGRFNYRRAYVAHYDFIPQYKLYEGATALEMTINIQNHKAAKLEYYYLCHINYAQFEGSKVVCTAKPRKLSEKERAELLRRDLSADENTALLNIVENPGEVEVSSENLSICTRELSYVYESYADECGDAHTLQIMPDGYSCYVKHRPDELPVSVRWIGYTEDERSMGMVLPSTCVHISHAKARELGHDRYLAPGEEITFHITTGLLSPEETEAVAAKIK